MSEKYIQFVANYDDWIAIRKLKIEPSTDPKTILEFLASLTTSVDQKIEKNLRKLVELQKLDAIIKEISTGKSEAEIANALREVNTRKISSVINEITVLPGLQKNEQKELAGFCKAYATRKVVKACKLIVDYSEIEIPGLKRSMKARKKS